MERPKFFRSTQLMNSTYNKEKGENKMQCVQYYSRPGCHLCEEGLILLKLVQEDVDFNIEIINIEEDDALHEKYMLMIPVVEKNNRMIQYGRLDYITLLEALSD